MRYWTGYGYMNSSTGLAAIGPPWSTITAYDMNKGTLKWQIPLGGVTELEAKGITGTGSFWPRGGGVVTAGGLILIGTRSDSKLHAYDKDTGKLLWETVLPAGPQGVPAVYEIAGREYVALAAQSVPKPGQKTVKSTGPETTGYYVFALPKKP
jgi:quinoprotein glucose dehydrogenase